jgi:hypothetical protein
MKEDMVKSGHEALKDFFDQFGPNDIYKQIFMEELFKFIYQEFYGVKIPDSEAGDEI